jgi:hypothetical protein
VSDDYDGEKLRKIAAKRMAGDVENMRQAAPRALNLIADAALAHRPKPKTKPARRRQRTRRKLEKENG